MFNILIFYGHILRGRGKSYIEIGHLCGLPFVILINTPVREVIILLLYIYYYLGLWEQSLFLMPQEKAS